MSPSEPPLILLIDDELDVSRVTCLRLRANGYEVRHEADGLAGLAAAREPSVSLLLLDLNLPGLSGQEICRLLKADPATARLPVILISASVEDLPLVAREVGADAYLGKPYESAALLATISTWIAPPVKISDEAVVPLRFAIALPSFLAARRLGIEKARAGLAAGDWTPVRELSHNLRGCSGVDGFAALGGAADRIKRGALELNAPAVLAEIESLEAWLGRLKLEGA